MIMTTMYFIVRIVLESLRQVISRYHAISVRILIFYIIRMGAYLGIMKMSRIHSRGAIGVPASRKDNSGSIAFEF